MNRQEELEKFATKFQTRDLYLKQEGAWDIAVRPDQLTLGSMVVSVRSGAFTFGELTAAEHQDMAAAFATAERIALGTFGAMRINILCLMMQDPIVHFHILPRYAEPQLAIGQTWTDTDWPGPPKIAPSNTPKSVLLDVRAALLKNI